jgi:uncharacterized membrane protein YeaQ/YmgE (transglycosylase-associated protein family)
MTILNVINAATPVLAWTFVGVVAGVAADRLVQGGRLGVAGNVVAGLLGSYLGGYALMDVLEISIASIFWCVTTALAGSFVLLVLANGCAFALGLGRPRRT